MAVAHLRVARPVTDLAAARERYARGLGLQVLGHFEDHAGFDGVMLGSPGAQYHLELTRSRTHAVKPAPTVEDLLVLYIPDAGEWDERCAAMAAAGFRAVASFNPYWDLHGRTFEDADGYRIVLQRAPWSDTAA